MEHQAIELDLLFLPRQLIFEVIIIDDNSPDGTQEVAKRLQAVYGSERIVSLRHMTVIYLGLTVCASCTILLHVAQAAPERSSPYRANPIMHQVFNFNLLSPAWMWYNSICRCCAPGRESWVWVLPMSMD